MTGPAHLRGEGLSLSYGRRDVVTDLTIDIPADEITVIVGANACGKTTLLRGLARLLAPRSGVVTLDGKDIHALPTKLVAERLGLLPQAPVTPDGIQVADLVGRGRYPHQSWIRHRTTDDDAAVARALTATNTVDLADRVVDELSGGQRQRVWIAMALAQETDLLLLDEPTAFLDVGHQVEVLDLLTDLNRQERKTIVLVLHDLNVAGRYADHLIAMKDGRIVAQGPPRGTVTEELVASIFDLPCRVVPDPVSDTPMVVPIGRHHTDGQAPSSTASRTSGSVASAPDSTRSW
jgi:iron complex transport system ATP-binding protein